MAHPLLSDPFVSEEIERAIAPYAAALDAEELAWVRDQLATMLEEEEDARALLDAAYPRVVERSGEQLRPGRASPTTASEPNASPLKRKGARGR